MCRKMFLVLFAVMLTFSAAGELVPGWMWWDGEGSDDLWTTGDNWRRTDGAYPDNTPPNADCNVSLGYFSTYSPAYAQITEGMDITIHGFSVGNRGEGTLDMTGGTLNAYYMNNTQSLSTARATVNMYGGQINIETSIGVARDGTGVINLEGGTITCKLVMFALKSTGVGTINLNGGELIVEYDPANPDQDNLQIRDGSRFVISDGVLKYNTGGLLTVDNFVAFVDAGKIVPDTSEDPRRQVSIETVGDYIVVSTYSDDRIPYNPTPQNGGIVTESGTELGWAAGSTAVSHNIYFSNNTADVENAADTSSPFCIAAEIPDPQFYVDGLSMGSTYYWRVDEVEAGGEVIKGFVWSFSRDQYSEAVETFDTYATYIDMLDNGWAEEAGAYVDLVTDAGSAQDGNRAMVIDCYNSSTMTKTFDSSQDWSTAHNSVSLLQVYIKGELANNASGASVILTDNGGQSAAVNFEDPSRLTTNDNYDKFWIQWLMPLADFTAANPQLNLTQITTMSISIDMVGSGKVYVDSIYLYSSGCYYGKSAGDLNGDCMIDIDDYSIMARSWLKSDPATPTAQPIVWYQFDETSGSTAADSSGNDYTATAKAGGEAATAIWSDQGKSGGCIEFDGTYCMKFSGTEISALSEEVTVSLWINGDPEVQPAAGITFAAADTPMGLAKQLNAHMPWSSSYVYFDTGGDNTSYDRVSWLAPAQAYKYGWNHYAFTKNAQTGQQKIYHNGSLVASASGRTKLMDIAEIAIGMSTNEASTPYIGRVDDFRIYNVELSADDILAISGYPRRGDFAGDDDFVDSADFGVLADGWLSQVLWPAE
ncbi:hypothetical protein SMSP2_00705 [Limihaloglobus sulfuriphilus]|uniref:LamG-like jellyroll fold domain-containing protein n=1 Tax=Limihaloglobus sulfuriphilus TaxID=1851148 RepID=A0A1Q2MCH9_9BACT|nr:LamG-like jellyroll fold domain-containing protein [Limihaloglobus sulfuriphilus]AQQ70359.1 hypothetical protein SMSP2_00705 [Limihaloglobus sulfuriphilus]